MTKKIGFIAIGMMLVSLLYAAAINGVIDVPEVSVSTNPPTGWWRLFFKPDGKLYKRNSAGTETEIGAGGGGGGGSVWLANVGPQTRTRMGSGSWESPVNFPNSSTAVAAADFPAGGCLIVESKFLYETSREANAVIYVRLGSATATVIPDGAMVNNSTYQMRVTVCNKPGATDSQSWTVDATTRINASATVAYSGAFPPNTAVDTSAGTTLSIAQNTFDTNYTTMHYMRVYKRN